MQNPKIHPEPESVPESVLDLYETMKKTLLRKYLWVLDTRKEMLAGQGRQEQTAITFCRPDGSDPVVLKDDPSKSISKVSTFEGDVVVTFTSDDKALRIVARHEIEAVLSVMVNGRSFDLEDGASKLL